LASQELAAPTAEDAASVAASLFPPEPGFNAAPLTAPGSLLNQDIVSQINANQEAADRVAIQQARIAERQAAGSDVIRQDVERRIQDLQQQSGEEVAALQQRVETQLQAVENIRTQIDPNRLYGDAVSPHRIVAGMAIALGRIGANLAGSNVNEALQIVNQGIARDIQVQQANIASNRQQQTGLLGMYMQQLQSKEAAIAATRTAMLEDAARRMELIGSQVPPGSEVSDSVRAASLAVQQEALKSRQELTIHLLDQDTRASNAERVGPRSPTTAVSRTPGSTVAQDASNELTPQQRNLFDNPNGGLHNVGFLISAARSLQRTIQRNAGAWDSINDTARVALIRLLAEGGDEGFVHAIFRGVIQHATSSETKNALRSIEAAVNRLTGAEASTMGGVIRDNDLTFARMLLNTGGNYSTRQMQNGITDYLVNKVIPKIKDGMGSFLPNPNVNTLLREQIGDPEIWNAYNTYVSGTTDNRVVPANLLRIPTGSAPPSPPITRPPRGGHRPPPPRGGHRPPPPRGGHRPPHRPPSPSPQPSSTPLGQSQRAAATQVRGLSVSSSTKSNLIDRINAAETEAELNTVLRAITRAEREAQ